MAGVEASGKTVEEAIESALEELGATREDVEFEVLSEAEGRHPRRRRAPRRACASGARRRSGRRWAKPAAAEGEAAEGDEFIEDDAEIAAQMLDQLLELMGIEADVSIRDAETPGDGLGMAKAVLDVEGDDLGLLIGRRGETLASLQYLLNLMVEPQARRARDLHRRRRGLPPPPRAAAHQLAHRMADQVQRTQRPSRSSRCRRTSAASST